MKIRITLYSIIVLFLSFISSHAHSGFELEDCDLSESVQEECFTSWSFFTDQDFLTLDSYTGFNEDRDYTMGLGFSVSGHAVTNWPIYSGMQSSIDLIEELRVDQSEDFPSAIVHTASIGDTAFTPDDLATSEPVFDDRPYSNLFYLSYDETKYYAEHQYAIKNTLVLGALGLSIGKGTQRWIHCDLGAATCPEGWSNQISNGGELTGLYRFSQINNVYDIQSDWGWPQVITYGEFDIGYYTDIAAGVIFRYGRVRTPFYMFNPSPQGNANMASGDTSSNDLYFYLRLGGRSFAYNALLQGQFKDNVHEFENNQLRRTIGEGSFGIVWQPSDFRITYAFQYRSSEIKGTLADREHWFAGLYIDFLQ